MKQSIKIETENYDVCNEQTKVIYGFGTFPFYHYFVERLEEEFNIRLYDIELEKGIVVGIMREIFVDVMKSKLTQNNWRDIMVTFSPSGVVSEDSYPVLNILFSINRKGLQCGYIEEQIKETPAELSRGHMDMEEMVIYLVEKFENHPEIMVDGDCIRSCLKSMYYMYFLCLKELADENHIVTLSINKDIITETELSVNIENSTCTITKPFSEYFHERLSKEFGIGITNKFRENFDSNIKNIFTKVIKGRLEEKKEEQILVKFSHGIITQRYPDYEIVFSVTETGLCCDYSSLNVSMKLTTIADLIPAIEQVADAEFEMDLDERTISSLYYMFFGCVEEMTTEENRVITLLV